MTNSLEIILNSFLKSRKSEKTREYTKYILDFLNENSTLKNQGFVRSKDLKDSLVKPELIPNASSFFKLLEDLESIGIIERVPIPNKNSSRGKAPVYYRQKQGFGKIDIANLAFLSKSDLISKCEELQRQIMDLSLEKVELLRIINRLIKENPNGVISAIEVERNIINSMFNRVEVDNYDWMDADIASIIQFKGQETVEHINKIQLGILDDLEKNVRE
jgi:hypothetical protein